MHSELGLDLVSSISIHYLLLTYWLTLIPQFSLAKTAAMLLMLASLLPSADARSLNGGQSGVQ